jgi:hypothetical protein
MSAEQIYNLLGSDAAKDFSSEDEVDDSGKKTSDLEQPLGAGVHRLSAPVTEGGIGQVLDAPAPDVETPTIEEQIREWNIAVNQATTVAMQAGTRRCLPGCGR